MWIFVRFLQREEAPTASRKNIPRATLKVSFTQYFWHSIEAAKVSCHKNDREDLPGREGKLFSGPTLKVHTLALQDNHFHLMARAGKLRHPLIREETQNAFKFFAFYSLNPFHAHSY